MKNWTSVVGLTGNETNDVSVVSFSLSLPTRALFFFFQFVIIVVPIGMIQYLGENRYFRARFPTEAGTPDEGTRCNGRNVEKETRSAALEIMQIRVPGRVPCRNTNNLPVIVTTRHVRRCIER